MNTTKYVIIGEKKNSLTGKTELHLDQSLRFLDKKAKLIVGDWKSKYRKLSQELEKEE